MNQSPPVSPPVLRCPACAFMTPLPATHCARCGAHLATGFVPVDEAEENAARRKRQILAGLVFLLLLGLAGLFLAFSSPKPSPPQAGPSVPANEVEAAVETIRSLSEQPGANPGVRPDIIINRTKAVAGQVENRRETGQESPD